jgi:drug/metabolite transporter (DMT)-like permease
MRILVLSILSLSAFAANSVLNRAALADGAIDPAGFAAIRVCSALVMLGAVFWIKERRLPDLPPSFLGPVGLLIYTLGFSFAYQQLTTGFGALLLFGAVQIAMFVAARLRGQSPNAIEVVGAVIAFVGLVYLLLPSLALGGIVPSALMIAAGIGWAAFSVTGQSAGNPLEATTSTFGMILIPVVLVWFISKGAPVQTYGIVLAVISGAVTSGLGYLIWYTVLPKLATTTAAVMQLTVPVIAILAGILLLNEPFELRVWISSGVVIMGVLISLFARKVAK